MKQKRKLLIFVIGALPLLSYLPDAFCAQGLLIRERNLRDAFISDPPFSTSAQSAPAPAPPAYSPQPQHVTPPASSGQPQPVYIPAAPPVPIPEMMARGYSIDPSGAINVIGMDGVLRTIDGTRPLKLIFPAEYGLAPQIVGGTTAPRQVYDTALPTQIAVRGYSIHQSGAIFVLGMDGQLLTLDGSRQVTLVFPPEYGLPPKIVGGAFPSQAYAPTAPVAVMQPQAVETSPSGSGDGQVQVSSSGGAEIPAALIQEGFGAIIRQIQKGQSRK